LGTKSKNNNEKNDIQTQNKVSKKVCILMLAALIFFLSGFFGFSNMCETELFVIPIQTSDINDAAVRYVKNLNRFYVYFKNFDSDFAYQKIKEFEKVMTEDRKISVSDMNKIKGNIEENAYISVENSDGMTEQAEATAETTETEDLYFEKAPELYYINIVPESIEQKEKLVSAYKDLKEVYDNYELVRNYLKNNKSFQYKIIENVESGNVYINNENIENEEYYYRFSLDDPLFNSIKFNGEFLSASFEKNYLTGYIIIPKNIANGNSAVTYHNNDYDNVYSSIKERETIEKVLRYANYTVPVLFLIAFIIIIYIIAKEKTSAYLILKKLYSKYRKIPFCIKIVLLLLSIRFFDSYLYAIIGNMSAGSGYYNIITSVLWSGGYYPLMIAFDIIMLLLLSVVFAAGSILSLMFIIDMAGKPSKLKDEYEIRFITDVARDTKYIFYTQNYRLFILYLILSIGTIVSLLLFAYVLFVYNPFFDDFYFAITVIVVSEVSGLLIVYEIMKLILAYCKLSYCIENMAEGSVKNVIENSKSFQKPFDNLNVINDDINKKIEEMMKNERLKTELITNVSHDLKTPLTSIINYIDLLKGEKFDNNSAKEYIEILDGKSQRLKTLIDDLFEASKLSAKQYKLDVSKSDVVALLKQTIGELNNKIEETNINFIIELPNNSIYLDIDGQKIWRVFDNLLNNIIKYSPEKSRAYISLEETEDEVKIIMKNVSKAPLNFDADELFERFKRGDSSRTTEGSGLGLSIAKSIVELHNGKIFINIDGDLFKVIVLLKK